jgi:hypothetical protein
MDVLAEKLVVYEEKGGDRLILTTPPALADSLQHKSYGFKRRGRVRRFLERFLGQGGENGFCPCSILDINGLLNAVFWVRPTELCMRGQGR